MITDGSPFCNLILTIKTHEGVKKEFNSLTLSYNLQIFKLLFYYNILFIFIFIILIEYFIIKSNYQVYADKKDSVKQNFFRVKKLKLVQVVLSIIIYSNIVSICNY